MDPLTSLWARFGAVEELQIDDEFRSHMAQRSHYREHRVSVSEIFELFDGEPAFFQNGGTRRAPIIMVGPTARGRLLCVPLEPAGMEGVWRVVTAFEANAGHRQRYQEATQ